MRGTYIMKYLPTAVTVKVARQALLFKKNSPALMFGLGVAGAVTSTVLACKATLKLDEVLSDAEKTRAMMGVAATERSDKYSSADHSSDLRTLRIQTAVKVAKIYAPAIGVGVVSVGLLTGAHITLTRRNAALGAAYAVVDKAFKEYRSRVVDELGEQKDKEFRYGTELTEIVEEGEHGHEVKTVTRHAVKGGSMYARVFAEGNTHWSRHPGENPNFLRVTQNWMNEKLRANGFLLLNDVYEALDFPRTTEGCVVGWVKGGKGDDYVDFGIRWDDETTWDYLRGENQSFLVDFNVDGEVYRLINKMSR